MIQQSINQLLNVAGFAARLSPSYEQREQAKSVIGKANIAQAGLEDISQNLQNPEKEYTKTELEDIKSRVAEHNKNIYTAKTLGESNPYAKKGASQLPSQSTYSPMLKNIETNLEKRELALQRMREKGNSSIEQNKQFNELRRLISEKFSNYGGEGLITDTYYIPYDLKKEIEPISKYNERTSKEYKERLIKKYGKDYENNPEYKKDLDSIFKEEVNNGKSKTI